MPGRKNLNMSSGVYNQPTGYHNRRSIRLRGYDYSNPGYYFVTICIDDRKQHLFGEVVDAKMVENEYCKIIRDELTLTERMRPNVKIDEFVIMPNHMHIIFNICDIPVGTMVGAYCNTPLRSNINTRHQPNIDTPLRSDINTPQRPNLDAVTGSGHESKFVSPSKTIGAIVRGIKSTVTKQINILRHSPGIAVWQRNYYDHIVRDQTSLYFIRNYIRENPSHWDNDAEYHINREINEFDMEEVEPAMKKAAP
jgi:putative transposase